MPMRPRTAIAIFAALIFASMPGATTEAAISAFMNPGDTLVSNFTPFHADVQTCSSLNGTGNITDLTHLPIVYLATLHLGSLPQRAFVMCDVGTEFKVSDTGSSPGSTLGIKVTGGASWDGALMTFGISGDIATSYISLNLLDITPGSSDAPVTRNIDQAQVVACVPFTILNIPAAPCLWPDDGNGQADINTTVQRGHTYRAYYEVYCAANAPLGSDSCDYASTALGYNMTLGALSVHLGDDQYGSLTKTGSDVLAQSTIVQTKIADAVTTIAGDITAEDADLTSKINAGVTSILSGQDDQFIENNLATCTGHPILYIPASLGGKLDKVQALMNTRLGQLRSMGVTPTVAQSYYNLALTNITQHNYPMAWANFCKSYTQLVVHSNGTLTSP